MADVPKETNITAGVRCPKCGSPPKDPATVTLAVGLAKCERCGRHSTKEAWLVNIRPMAHEVRRVREG